MNFNDSIVIINLLLIVFMLVNIFTNTNLSKRNTKNLIIAYLMLGLIVILEWYCNSFYKILKETIFLKVAKIIDLTIIPILPILYAEMFFNDLISSNYKVSLKNDRIISYVLTIFNALLEIILSKSFYINSKGCLNIGKSCIIYTIVFLNSIAYFFIVVYTFDKYFQRKATITLLGFLILGITGVLMQFTNPNLKVSKLFFSLVSIFIYMYYNENSIYIDNLTGLLNQCAYKKRLLTINKPVTILLFDVDSFKSINDNYGHNFGDFALSTIGKCIKIVYNEYGTCYRIGGDEFCVILDHADVIKLNSSFVSKLETFRKNDSRLPYVSIGYSRFKPNNGTILDAIDDADKNLYYWKEELKRKRYNLS